MSGPYYATHGEKWLEGDRPQERAFVRGPGLDGTILGPTAHAEATSRAEHLNLAYESGRKAAETMVANEQSNKAYNLGMKDGQRALRAAQRKRKRGAR